MDHRSGLHCRSVRAAATREDWTRRATMYGAGHGTEGNMAVDFSGVTIIVVQGAPTRAEVVRVVQQAEVARAAGQEAATRAQADVERALREAAQQVERAQRDAERAQRDAERAVRNAERQARDAEWRTGSAQPPPWVQDFPPGGPQVPEGAIIISIAFFVMCAVIAIGVPLARAFARRMDKRAVAPLADNDTRMRLERIEHAVDAIALEVERISEGQRFTSKVLSGMHALPEAEPADAPLVRARERR